MRSKHENYEAARQCRIDGCERLSGYSDGFCEYHHEDSVRRQTREATQQLSPPIVRHGRSPQAVLKQYMGDPWD